MSYICILNYNSQLLLTLIVSTISLPFHYSSSIPDGQILLFPRTGMCLGLIVSLTSIISSG